jgi:hypothetical protein
VRPVLFLGICLGIAAGVPATAITVPAGTELQLRLTKEVSSDKPSGQPIAAVVIAPALINGAIAVGFGTVLEGQTADAHANVPAANGTEEQPATLRLVFNKIKAPGAGGGGQSVTCVLEGVDNAREALDQSGLITGITASRTFTSLADEGVNKLASKSSQFGGILADIKKAIVKPADPSIVYKPGVEVTVKLTAPLEWTPTSNPAIPGAIASLPALTALVQTLPSRTQALKPPSPSDLTNLIFIGSVDQVKTAFKNAGWFEADPLDRASTYHTAQAIIENSGYDEAPVSVLTLGGKPPDFVFEKANNTFASRHHIRVWQVSTFEGQPLFVAAATHDIKIYFSKTSRSITHGIDPNIDKERTKVTNDFIFTGAVSATALVDRPGITGDLSNATGDQLQTDKKIAAIQLK